MRTRQAMNFEISENDKASNNRISGFLIALETNRMEAEHWFRKTEHQRRRNSCRNRSGMHRQHYVVRRSLLRNECG